MRQSSNENGDTVMSINRAAQGALAPTKPWAQAVKREIAQPVFPKLPTRARPYVLALTLFATACALMYVGNAALLRFGLPWALVSLLLVVAAANLWGVRAAGLVLALSIVYGAAVIPHLLPLPVSADHIPPDRVLAVRSVLFALCGGATIWLTDRARQMQEKAEYRREVVAALQSMILPDALALVPGYDLCGLYRPARHDDEVGGDFYDFYPAGSGVYGILIGDVMGKGKEAAASTGLLRYSVRAFASTGTPPAKILDQLNSLIDAQGLEFGTASLFVGFLDVRSGLLSYASAGHEAPLLQRADGEGEMLDSTGPILGVGPGITYDEKAVALNAGDALLLMTDGVTEARSEQGQFLDCAGAWRLFRTALRLPTAQKAVAALDMALRDYIGTQRCDDIALLLLRRTRTATDDLPISPPIPMEHVTRDREPVC